jgi:hypothetical protein
VLGTVYIFFVCALQVELLFSLAGVVQCSFSLSGCSIGFDDFAK